MEFFLAGQPNSGKSTIFNVVAGYKSIEANFPGVTVQCTCGEIVVDHQSVRLTDLPGTYSLVASDEAEKSALALLVRLPAGSVIINVIDASVLSRSLELTLQLMELQKPMVVAINMMDEADRKGITIDEKRLSEILGVPVVKTIGRKGEGIFELFTQACQAGSKKIVPHQLNAPIDIEKPLKQIIEIIASDKFLIPYNPRFLALKLMEKDETIAQLIPQLNPYKTDSKILSIISAVEKKHGQGSESVVNSVRHDLAFSIFEGVAKVGKARGPNRQKAIDDLLMHPWWGYVFLIFIFAATFMLVFFIGSTIEPIFIDNFNRLKGVLSTRLGNHAFVSFFLNGMVQGVGGGMAIVIPFLLPFFILLAFLEDSGYLARVAYMVDNIMHRIGLHGLSVVPMILGYGCTVPGIMATRLLRSPRDKFITATLTSMIPCSARMSIIFGLVGFFISFPAALLIYVINFVIIGLTGKTMSRVMPEVSPGLILEIPRYHLPTVKSVWKKTWFRLREFVLIAWPILIIGSLVLEGIDHFHLSHAINSFLHPFTQGILGLPPEVGVILIFGIMRKELAMILLFSSLGSKDISKEMTASQIFSFTLFVTFYVPCLATIAVLARELGGKKAILISILQAILAVLLAVVVRFIFPLFG